MKDFIFSITNIFLRHKLLFALLVGGFFVFLILFIPQEVPSRKESSITPTPINSSLKPTQPTSPNSPLSSNEHIDDDLDLSFLSDAQNKKTLTDGKTSYSFPSTNPRRPSLTIIQDQRIAFQRSIPLSMSLSGFIDLYGKPGWIFNGSKFYGPAAQTYIYPDLGLALIVKPDSGEVFEQHIFTPTRIEDYVKNFGEDLASSAPEL